MTSAKSMLLLNTIAIFAIAGFAFGQSPSPGSGLVEDGIVTLEASLQPGISPGSSTAVSFTAANPTKSAITVTNVHLESVQADLGHAGCETDDFTMEDVTQAYRVPPGATSEALPNKALLDYAETNANQDACQGATLTLTLSSD